MDFNDRASDAIALELECPSCDRIYQYFLVNLNDLLLSICYDLVNAKLILVMLLSIKERWYTVRSRSLF